MKKIFMLVIASAALLLYSCNKNESEKAPEEINTKTENNASTDAQDTPGKENMETTSNEIIEAEGQMKTDLSNEFKKMSYAVGQQRGAVYHRDSIDIDFESFMAGFHDGFKKIPNQISNDEIRELYNKFSEIQDARRQKKVLKAMKKNELDRKEMPLLSKKILAENKKKNNVTETSTGLQYTIIEKGNGKTLPKEGYVAKVNAILWNLDSVQVTSTYERGEEMFANYYLMQDGFMEGINLVGEGGSIDLLVPAEIGFGGPGLIVNPADPTVPRIPGNTAVYAKIDVIEYLTIEEANANGANLPASEDEMLRRYQNNLPEDAPVIK